MANPKTTLPLGRSRFGSDGTIASSKDVERIPLHCFSRLVIHHFLSSVTEVFFARTMHSTSGIRYVFWSKCVWSSSMTDDLILVRVNWQLCMIVQSEISEATLAPVWYRPGFLMGVFGREVNQITGMCQALCYALRLALLSHNVSLRFQSIMVPSFSVYFRGNVHNKVT